MKRLKLLACALAGLAAPAAAQTVAITNARIATAASETVIEGGTVVIRDGRIAAVGKGIAVPAGAQVIDGTGKWVTPGLIGGFTRLGLIEVDAVDPTEDAEAGRSPFTASIDVAPGVNQRSTNIPINRIEGVTRAVVAPMPGRSVFVGQGAVISLGDAPDIVLRPRAFQFVELGERGAELAGGSRGAAFAEFRNGLREALSVARNPAGYDSANSRTAILTREDARALLPVVRGTMPLVVHAERASDIERVLDLKREFGSLRLILVGASEGWMVADKLAAARVPVIASALNDLPERFETLAATESNVGRLVKAGVTVALGMIDDNDGRQIRLLPQHAGNLVAVGRVPGATGLSWGQALAAMTRAPAEIFGLSDLGTLASGKRADVVVWDGDPLELASAPVAVLIDGRPVPLVSRQTKLRDRYLPNRDNSNLPTHYTR